MITIVEAFLFIRLLISVDKQGFSLKNCQAGIMSARTGLRYGELSELVWRDITLNGENSHVLVRASISKNKKEARIPLIPELEELLASFRPQDAKPTDRVFKEGVPRCATLRKDLEAAIIPYIDESGRYADFHALRYTFNTWLQTNGVPP